MSFLALLFLIAVLGAIMGICAGLLGVGGGIFIVPILYLILGGSTEALAVVSGHEAAIAHATSLFVIIFAALSGLWVFQREGAVNWAVVLPLAGVAAVAALAGAQVAAALPSPLLKALFGAFLIASGFRLLRRQRGDLEATGVVPSNVGPGIPLRWWGAVAGGATVGFLSALLGVGGGIVAIPILIHFARMEVHRVVPASIAIICFAAPAGVVGYALAGQGVQGLPPGSLGFVHLPTALAMLPGAILMAPVGVRLNRRLRGRTLELVFAALMIVVGGGLILANGQLLIVGP